MIQALRVHIVLPEDLSTIASSHIGQLTAACYSSNRLPASICAHTNESSTLKYMHLLRKGKRNLKIGYFQVRT